MQFLPVVNTSLQAYFLCVSHAFEMDAAFYYFCYFQSIFIGQLIHLLGKKKQLMQHYQLPCLWYRFKWSSYSSATTERRWSYSIHQDKDTRTGFQKNIARLWMIIQKALKFQQNTSHNSLKICSYSDCRAAVYQIIQSTPKAKERINSSKLYFSTAILCLTKLNWRGFD